MFRCPKCNQITEKHITICDNIYCDYNVPVWKVLLNSPVFVCIVSVIIGVQIGRIIWGVTYDNIFT